MKKRAISNLLKVFITLFIVFTLFFMSVIWPVLARQALEFYPEVGFLYWPLMLLSQGLLVLFIIGLVIIFYLLVLYDREQHLSPRFVQLLKVLVAFCALAAIVVIGVFIYFNSNQILSPGAGLLLMVTFLLVSVVGLVILLIKSVIEQTIEYKEEMDMVI